MEPKQRFRVTHPFHPWLGKEIEFEADREGCEFKRLRYRRPNGSIAFFPRDWTDQALPDPFRAWASGRAIARPADFLKLTELVRSISQPCVK